MLKYNNSKFSLFNNFKRIVAIVLSISSVKFTTYGLNNFMEEKRYIPITQVLNNRNNVLLGGIGVNNDRYNNLLNQIGNLREMNREELVRIFEDEFLHIIIRDAENINRRRITATYKRFLINMLRNYNLGVGNGVISHLINLLWMGGLFIFLDERHQGIESMKRDFRNWRTLNITIEDLKRYFIERL